MLKLRSVMHHAFRSDSRYKHPAVTASVTPSVTGAAIHTPVIPNRTGSVKIQASSTTSPREKEISADSNAFPVAVK